MTIMQDIYLDVETFLASARLAAKDGLTWAEIGSLFDELKLMLVSRLREVVTKSGHFKKQYVMDSAAALFDVLKDSIPWPFWLSPFRRFLTPVLKTILLSMVDGGVEAIYSRLKNTT